MADEQNPVFDQTLPTPEPITLTFGEESAPEGKAPEQSAAANPTESASDALAQAKDALSQAQGVLSDVQNAAGATFASNGVSVVDAVNAAGAAMAAAPASAPSASATLNAAMAAAPAAPGVSYGTTAAQSAAAAAQDTSFAFSPEEPLRTVPEGTWKVGAGVGTGVGVTAALAYALSEKRRFWVSRSQTPLAVSPLYFWKFFTALLVAES